MIQLPPQSRLVARLGSVVAGLAAVLGVALVAAPGAAATAGPPAGSPGQYVGYGYYGYPGPAGLPTLALGYPGSGAAAWLGPVVPYPYPSVTYAYPPTGLTYPDLSMVTSPYVGSPGYPYYPYGASYGNAVGPTTYWPSDTWPSDYGSYYDQGGYVSPDLCGWGGSC
ncbi:MAG TPA: hypothetical protein VII06_08575 [Chloroflexota bacterium]|jgi:hypothetical protein